MFIRNEEKKSMGDKRTEKYNFKSYVRGFHVYQEIWTPVIGECLECRHEPRNVEDKSHSRDKRWNCGWTCAEMFQLVDENVSWSAEK